LYFVENYREEHTSTGRKCQRLEEAKSKRLLLPLIESFKVIENTRSWLGNVQGPTINNRWKEDVKPAVGSMMASLQQLIAGRDFWIAAFVVVLAILICFWVLIR